MLKQTIDGHTVLWDTVRDGSEYRTWIEVCDARGVSVDHYEGRSEEVPSDSLLVRIAKEAIARVRECVCLVFCGPSGSGKSVMRRLVVSSAHPVAMLRARSRPRDGELEWLSPQLGARLYDLRRHGARWLRCTRVRGKLQVLLLPPEEDGLGRKPRPRDAHADLYGPFLLRTLLSPDRPKFLEGSRTVVVILNPSEVSSVDLPANPAALDALRRTVANAIRLRARKMGASEPSPREVEARISSLPAEAASWRRLLIGPRRLKGRSWPTVVELKSWRHPEYSFGRTNPWNRVLAAKRELLQAIDRVDPSLRERVERMLLSDRALLARSAQARQRRSWAAAGARPRADEP